MKTLYLLRHADPVPAADIPMGDYARGLSPAGVEQTRSLAGFLTNNRVFPDFVLGSAAVRTVQTARNIFGHILRAEGMKLETHFARALYLAPADRLLQFLHVTEDCHACTLVVAHNPGIAELAYHLSNGTLSDFTTDYKTGTLSVFTADVDSWADFTPAHARLETVFVP